MWRKVLGILGSLVKGLVAFIEHLLYVMHYLRCLAYTPSLVLTTTLGNKYISFTNEETDGKKLKTESQSWGLNTVSRMHRLCVLFHLVSGHKGGRKEELEMGLTWVSCSHNPHVSLSHPLRVTLSPRLGQLQDLQDLPLPLARGEAGDSSDHHQDL